MNTFGPLSFIKSFFYAIRIVTTYKSADLPSFFQSYAAAYETLHCSRPLTCVITGEVIDAIPPPNAVILDVRISYSCARHQFTDTVNRYSFVRCLNVK